MLKPKVAIVGVGNCASVLIQGLDYYSKRKDGLWHPKVGGYTVSDISLSAAFDIDRRKVGLDLSEAIFASPNVAQRFVKVSKKNIEVKPGIMVADKPPHLSSENLSYTEPSNFVRELENSG